MITLILGPKMTSYYFLASLGRNSCDFREVIKVCPVLICADMNRLIFLQGQRRTNFQELNILPKN